MEEILDLLRQNARLSVEDIAAMTKKTTDEVKQIIKKLDEYYQTHDFITRRLMEGHFGLTKYMAQKWLDELCTQPPVYLEARKIANVRAYFRR